MKKTGAAKKSANPDLASGASPGGPRTEVRVQIAADVQQRIRHHARSSLDAEICGVLIGSIQDGATVIANTIEGQNARQAGTHVTFTQETWAHVYEVKDSKYPDDRIVGWYHSHPGFGVFLSEHDMFIHKNFFTDPNQVAWVFDPHNDEEGCFVWDDGEVVRLQNLEVRGFGNHSVDSPLHRGEDHREDPEGGDVDSEAPPPRRSLLGKIVKWGLLALSHLFVLVVGFFVAELFFPSMPPIPPGYDLVMIRHEEYVLMQRLVESIRTGQFTGPDGQPLIPGTQKGIMLPRDGGPANPKMQPANPQTSPVPQKSGTVPQNASPAPQNAIPQKATPQSAPSTPKNPAIPDGKKENPK